MHILFFVLSLDNAMNIKDWKALYLCKYNDLKNSNYGALLYADCCKFCFWRISNERAEAVEWVVRRRRFKEETAAYILPLEVDNIMNLSAFLEIGKTGQESPSYQKSSNPGT